MSNYKTITGGDALSIQEEKGFSRPNKWIALMPDFEEIERDADSRLNHILNGLFCSLVAEDYGALKFHLQSLCGYVGMFSHRYPLATHTRLISLVYHIFTHPKQSADIVHESAEALLALVKKSRLSRRNVELPWRPAFDLFVYVKYGKNEQEVEKNKIADIVYKLKKFYPLTATREMWDEILLRLSPLKNTDQFSDLCVHFLPTNMTIEEHSSHGASIWLDTVWSMYAMIQMNNKTANRFPELFAYLQRDCPEFYDWTKHYDDIFTRILRSMGLTARDGKILVGDGTGMLSLLPLAKWVAYSLGGEKSCQPHLSRLMSCLQSHLHPSNSGIHTQIIMVFLITLANGVVQRYKRERVKKYTKDKVCESARLSDMDIRLYVSSQLPSLLPAVFTDCDSNHAAMILKLLGSLAPDIVMPKIFDIVYPSLHAVCEPHRLQQTLDCILETVLLICTQSSDSGRVKMMEETALVRCTSSAIMGLSKDQFVSVTSDSIRSHSLTLIKILSEGIDINDIDKTCAVIQILSYFLMLIPLVDCSSISNDPSRSLTSEEKRLCELSRQLPVLAECTVDKILTMIDVVAVCPPKSATQDFGTLKDPISNEGYDEKKLKESADKCIQAIFSSADVTLRKKLAHKIFDFVRDANYSSSVATTLIGGLIGQVIYFYPEIWPNFLHFLHKNVRDSIDVEVQKSKDVEIRMLWWANLCPAVLCVPSYLFETQWKKCTEIVDRLLECANKSLYEAGSLCLWYSLYYATHYYPSNENVRLKKLDRPLAAWTPVKEWAQLYNKTSISLRWHIPNSADAKNAQKLLDAYMEPHLDKLDKPELFISKEEMRKSLFIVSTLFCGSQQAIPWANEKEISLTDSKIPLYHANGVRVQHPISAKDTACLREKILSLFEGAAEFILKYQPDETQCLQLIAAFVRILVDPVNVDIGEYTHTFSVVSELLARVRSVIWDSKQCPFDLLEVYTYYEHQRYFHDQPPRPFTDLHRRVLKLLARFSVNAYADIRIVAQSELKSLLTRYPQAKPMIVDVILEPIKQDVISRKEVKGTLYVIRDNKLCSIKDIEARKKLWISLVKMKSVESDGALKLFDEVALTAQDYSRPDGKNKEEKENEEKRKENNVSVKMAKNWITALPKENQWTFLGEKSFYESEKKRNEELVETKKKQLESLVLELLKLCTDSSLHLKNLDLARSMLWQSEKKMAKPETIKILLSLTLDERAEMRQFGFSRLQWWMKKNKPMTKREIWNGPPRDPLVPKLTCGVRKDNLAAVYDSENLPNTEEKWNQMQFIQKNHGAYRWEKDLSVERPHSKGLPVEVAERSQCDELIVDHFSNAAHLQRMATLWLNEKHDFSSKSLNMDVVGCVKYLIRNYPNADKMIHFFSFLIQVSMMGKKREEQRMGADLFVGIVRGSRHFPFSRLSKLWKWLRPSVERLLDNLHSECERDWMAAFREVFYGEDVRRFWWLVETLINLISKEAPTSWHFAVRVDSLWTLNSWRETEVRNRIVRAVWEQLPNATIETQRVGVSSALIELFKCNVNNLNNDFKEVPERFRLDSDEKWLAKFQKKIVEFNNSNKEVEHEIMEEKPQKKSKSKSNSGRKVLLIDDGEKEPSKPSTSTNLLTVDLSKAEKSPTMDNCEVLANSPRLPTSKYTSLVRMLEKKNVSGVYLRTAVELLNCHYEQCVTSLNLKIIELLPFIIPFANEEHNEIADMMLGGDIGHQASILVFDYMSGTYVDEKYADALISQLNEVISSSPWWRVKQGVLRFLKVNVYANIFVYDKAPRKRKICDIVMRALVSSQAEVRVEAAKCLMNLVHSTYLDVSDSITERLIALAAQSEFHLSHGGVLGLCALVQAFPFECPGFMGQLIDTLCVLSEKKHKQAQHYATHALREFRRTHRDAWISTSRALGPILIFQIENACAPYYYV